MLGHIAWEGDLKQDVVEEEGAEDAAQLLPLLDVPQGESLGDTMVIKMPGHAVARVEVPGRGRPWWYPSVPPWSDLPSAGS